MLGYFKDCSKLNIVNSEYREVLKAPTYFAPFTRQHTVMCPRCSVSTNLTRNDADVN